MADTAQAPTIEQRLDALEAEASSLRSAVSRLEHFARTGDAYYDQPAKAPAKE